jgi:DNA invertase Pin-like site-specific DNA recombinase
MPGPSWSERERNVLRQFFQSEGAEGCMARMKKLALRGAPAIKQIARKLGLKEPRPHNSLVHRLTPEQVEEVIRLHDEETIGFKPIGERFGVCESTAANAYWAAMCPRRGYRPAARDENGHLLAPEIERLRAFLRKGTKPRDIQLYMGISAGTISNERRQYAAELKARGKRPLPPPGAGERYSGAKIPKEQSREVERLYLEGKATPSVSSLTGVSRTHCLRIRSKLVLRLARKKQRLPGCDQSGKRLTYQTPLRVPEHRRQELRDLLLERVPVRQAAIQTGIGGCTAYRIRDELRAELASQGLILPKPILPGRAARPGPWLPPQRKWWALYRQLEAQLGHDAAREQIEQALRTIAALPSACERAVRLWRRSRPLSFEEQLAKVSNGAALTSRFEPRRADPEMTLGGIATGAL